MFDCANPRGRTGQRALSFDSAGQATGRHGAAHQTAAGLRRMLFGGGAFGQRGLCDAGEQRGGIAVQDPLARFLEIKLDPPNSAKEKLFGDLEYKAQMLLSAQGHYLRCIRVGHPEGATASGYRIGAPYGEGARARVLVKPGAHLTLV